MVPILCVMLFSISSCFCSSERVNYKKFRPVDISQYSLLKAHKSDEIDQFHNLFRESFRNVLTIKELEQREKDFLMSKKYEYIMHEMVRGVRNQKDKNILLPL